VNTVQEPTLEWSTRSILFRKFVSYGRKMFMKLTPGRLRMKPHPDERGGRSHHEKSLEKNKKIIFF
jgi:hypothetical protein